MSAQVSSAAIRIPATCAALARALADRGQQIDAGEARVSLRHAHLLRLGEGIGLRAAPGQDLGAQGVGRQGQQMGAVLHQRLVGRVRPVPFQQGEFRMVQRPALAVAPHPGQIEDLRLAGRQQLLGRELRRGVQVQDRATPIRPNGLCRKGMQMGLIARRDLQGGRLHLGEALVLEPAAHGPGDLPAGGQEGTAVAVGVLVPPGGHMRHEAVSPGMENPRQSWRKRLRSYRCAGPL